MLKTSANSWYLEETLERLEVSVSFVELAWMSKKWKKSWNLLKSGSFNICRNTIVPMIAILGCSEIDKKVLDVGIETVESDNCKEVLENNRDANSILAVILKRARFSYKDRWNFINLFT